MNDLREQIARTVAFAGRDKNDMCNTADEFWHHSGDEWREKFYRQADAILELIKGAVKPLEWVGTFEISAESEVGTYVIESGQASGLNGFGRWWAWSFNPDKSDPFFGWQNGEPAENEEAAKAAAQADYTRRILATIGVE